jgi:hypothetical protein
MKERKRRHIATNITTGSMQRKSRKKKEEENDMQENLPYNTYKNDTEIDIKHTSKQDLRNQH